MINGPRDRDRKPSLTSRSRTTASCKVDLDEETIGEVAKSKSAIKDMFEGWPVHQSSLSCLKLDLEHASIKFDPICN